MELFAQKNMICAGIVLYNPDEVRLQQNICAILPQVSFVLLIDNASKNIGHIETAWGAHPKVQIIKNDNNEGIARALNQMCEAAFSQKYEWILTLDQDSVCPDNLIRSFLPYLLMAQIGIVCPRFRLTIGVEPNETDTSKLYDFIDYCITSASLTNLSAWKHVGGFDDWMFIDCVDYDFCIKLRKSGYRIVRINRAIIDHQVGNAIVKKMPFGKNIVIYNHNSTRNYYMTRNTIYLIKKYRHDKEVYRWLPRLFYNEFCKLLLEGNKKNTLTSFVLGLKDGFLS